jgi:hypothetical protein
MKKRVYRELHKVEPVEEPKPIVKETKKKVKNDTTNSK